MEKIRILFALYAFLILLAATLYVVALLASGEYADTIGAVAFGCAALGGMWMLIALGRGE